MEPSYNEQQQQPSYGQRARSSTHQPTPSRPGTPSQYDHPQSPSRQYSVPTGSYPPRTPLSSYQHPATPGGDPNRSSPYSPAAAPYPAQSQWHAHPGYPSEMNQYPSSHNRDPDAQPFFPTPSQTMEYRQHADSSGQGQGRRSGSVSSPLNPGYNIGSRTVTQMPPVPLSQHYPSQSASTSAAPANYVPTSAGDRFVCSQCGASFSRSHDRKRHYETQHLKSPPVHRCLHCRKEFSRGDSLKRHLDHGCGGGDNN